jgi:hypothetical protein
MKRASKMFDQFLNYILDEHNQRRRLEGERFVVRDMVDVLLQLADDPNLEVQLSRDNVKALTQVISTTSLSTRASHGLIRININIIFITNN